MKKYFVLFGYDRINPDTHYRACKHKFDTLKEARAYAREYTNASVFRMYDDGSINEIKLIGK